MKVLLGEGTDLYLIVLSKKESIVVDVSNETSSDTVDTQSVIAHSNGVTWEPIDSEDVPKFVKKAIADIKDY